MSFIEKIPETQANLWQRKKPLLQHLDIELTERCNNNCIHCYINQPENDTGRKDKEISFETIADILAQAASLGCLTVRFTGGEPLLRDDFEKIYRFARKLGLRVMVYTNGTLISPELARLFSEIPPLAPIEITVYGMSPASASAVTRNATAFADCQKGRERLTQHRVPYILKWVPLPLNKGELDAFMATAAGELGAKGITDLITSLDARARRDNDKKNQRIRSLRLSPYERIAILTRDSDVFLEHMKAFYKSHMAAIDSDTLFTCGAGCSGCVDAYGMLQMCGSLRHPDTIYDLNQGNLKVALTNFFPEIRRRKATNDEFIKRCGHCFLRGICEQCPAKSWMENGTLDTPVCYVCDNTHAEAQFLGLLGKNEKGWEVVNWRERVQRIVGE